MESKDPKDEKPAEGAAPAAAGAAGATSSASAAGAAGDKPADAGVSPSEGDQATPKDALGKTNDELAEEGVSSGAIEDELPEKKLNPVKAFFRKVNVYLMGFLVIVAVVAATGIVSFLNSKKIPKTAEIASQQLSTDALKQLANSDASVGSATQTLTVQGNAIFKGQVLLQKDLDVAGKIRLGGDLQAQDLTVAGKTNLAETQANSLQVATTTVIEGATSLKDLTVSGVSSFSSPVTANQITVTKLILSGNAVLQVPNHVAFTGPSPARSIETATLGAGGTASINGSDTTGTVNINTGNSPVAGCFVKITFAQPFTTQPHVLVSPIGAGAGQTEYYVTRTLTGFNICTANAAPAGQVFGFDYFVTN